MDALRAAGLDDVIVVVGGFVPDGDEQMLLRSGVARVFHPGAALEEITQYLRTATMKVRADRAAAKEAI